MSNEADALRSRVIKALREQGFLINPHLKARTNDKQTIRQIHELKRKEAIGRHRKFLAENLTEMKRYSLDGDEIEPSKINLKMIMVEGETFESRVFFWWNLVWWSLPYTHPIGRQMRFVLWDEYHDAPFGLIGLQSPPLRSSVRDKFLGLDRENVDYWINQSMYGHRIGALPPFNYLIGTRMVALALTSNEVREAYKMKYGDKKTLLKKRFLPNRLLFITTTSAYGRGSAYERLCYENDKACKFIGFTAGSGTFHIPEDLYLQMLSFLKKEGHNVRRGYGTGPSRKLRLVDLALRKLKLGKLSFHNIKRGHYIFPNVSNLHGVIHREEPPSWHDRPFGDLLSFWKRRWCVPRSLRRDDWKRFRSDPYFEKVEKLWRED